MNIQQVVPSLGQQGQNGLFQNFHVVPGVSPRMASSVTGSLQSSSSGLFSMIAVASAASIGSNMVDVRQGRISMTGAISNGVVKGVAVSSILAKSQRTTPLQVAGTVALLAVAGFAIDSVMKKAQRVAVVEKRDEG